VTESIRTFCRVCQAQCGLVLDVDGDRIVRVNGDRDHAVSRGYTCSKGRALAPIRDRADRLVQPYLGGSPATWGATLSDLSGRLTRLIDEHGPASVACYRSSGWVFDTIGRMAVDRWCRAIGTNQLYSPATIDTPNRQLVPDLVAGAPFLQPLVDWEHTTLLIVLGQNLVVSHGHATAVPDPVRRLREIQARGGSIVVADPRVTETAQLADLHLQIRPGTDAALAAFLVRCRLLDHTDDDFLDECADPASVERLRDAVAPFDRDRTADICGVASDRLDTVT
jgi:anaerobic selenocysteine-containing dehydrogenase